VRFRLQALRRVAPNKSFARGAILARRQLTGLFVSPSMDVAD
jgi:hypothetical protein